MNITEAKAKSAGKGFLDIEIDAQTIYFPK